MNSAVMDSFSRCSQQRTGEKWGRAGGRVQLEVGSVFLVRTCGCEWCQQRREPDGAGQNQGTASGGPLEGRGWVQGTMEG